MSTSIRWTLVTEKNMPTLTIIVEKSENISNIPTNGLLLFSEFEGHK